MSKKSILLISYHSSLNNGDRALLEVNISQLNAAFDNPQITVTPAWPNEPYFNEATRFKVVPSAWNLIEITERKPFWRQMLGLLRGILYAHLFLAGLRIAVPSSWQRLFTAYEEADLIASVSSTHFYSTGRYGWPFPVKIFQIQLAHWFQKPFYVMPQSIGPLRWGWEKNMLRSAYGKARLVLLRDEESMRLAESIHLPKKRYRFSADPVFAFKGADEADALRLLELEGFIRSSPAIGITLTPWQGRWLSQEVMKNYFDSMAGFLKRFHKETGVQVFLFNQVTGPLQLDDDRVAAAELLKRLEQERGWFHHVDKVLSPEMLKACYGCMDLFIASRLHSGIFALGKQVPTVFIGYMAKTRGMMEWLGVADWVIELDQVNEEILLEKILKAWQERELRRALLAKKIPPLEAEVYQAAKWIRADFGNS